MHISHRPRRRWGDATTLLSTIPRESISMVFTDPPFGISTNKTRTPNSFSGYQPNKGAWDRVVPATQWVPSCIDALKPGGIFACFGVFGSLVPIWVCLEQDCRMRFQTHITWHKTNPAPCVHRRGLTLANEFILVYSKGANWHFDYAASKRQNHGTQQHNHIDCPAVRRQFGRTVKPPLLLQRYIELYCPRNGTVLDPFAGTGSILDAAQIMKRYSIGIELDRTLKGRT
jgi:site-specific DNA-methyltransferase (adenine-specific)